MVPPALKATVPVGLTHGAAQVIAKVEPAAIAWSNVMATELSTGTLMALLAGETVVTKGAMGAVATRSRAPRILSCEHPAARVASSATAHHDSRRRNALKSFMYILYSGRGSAHEPTG